MIKKCLKPVKLKEEEEKLMLIQKNIKNVDFCTDYEIKKIKKKMKRGLHTKNHYSKNIKNEDTTKKMLFSPHIKM